MKIIITDSFIKSLEKMNNRWYKIYQFLYNLPNFLKNLWLFRKSLWRFRNWDYCYNLDIFMRSLEITEKNIRYNGREVEESRLKKCDMILKTINIIKNIINDNYIELSEKELNKKIIYKGINFVPLENNLYDMVDYLTEEDKNNNNQIYKKSYEIEKNEWNELINILNGQNYSEFDKNKDWDEQFDGSGLRNWCD